MASFQAHLYWDRLFFGRTYPKIHKELDKHFKRLGRRHRMVNHNPLAAIQIAMRLYPGDPLAVRSALFHIRLDEICTRDPEFKKTVEAAAILCGGKKKRRKRRGY